MRSALFRPKTPLNLFHSGLTIMCLFLGSLDLTPGERDQVYRLLNASVPGRNLTPVGLCPRNQKWIGVAKEGQTLATGKRPLLFTLVGLFRRRKRPWFTRTGMPRPHICAVVPVDPAHVRAWRRLCGRSSRMSITMICTRRCSPQHSTELRSLIVPFSMRAASHITPVPRI